MKIVCLGIYWKNYEELAKFTFEENLRSYCKNNDYFYWSLMMNSELSTNREEAMKQITIEKTNIYLNIFKNYGADYIFHLDCDSVITNHSIKLEEIIIKYRHDFLSGSDKNGISTGQFILKNTEANKALFRESVHATENGKCDHGQDFINRFKKDLVFATPQRVMNSYDGEARLEAKDEEAHWQEGDFLVHLTGLTLERRMDRLDYWKGKVKK